MRTMRFLSAVFIGPLMAFVLFATAQEKSQKSEKASGTKTVTGCLQKGDEANEYSITDTQGKTYGLHSSTVKLGEHMGHKVTVTGKVKPEEENEAGERHQGNKKEVADLEVTNLKMVSESCP